MSNTLRGNLLLPLGIKRTKKKEEKQFQPNQQNISMFVWVCVFSGCEKKKHSSKFIETKYSNKHKHTYVQLIEWLQNKCSMDGTLTHSVR